MSITDRPSSAETVWSSARKDMMPCMGAEADPSFCVPRFRLLRRRLRRAWQPAKTVKLDLVKDILNEYGLTLTEAPAIPNVRGRSGNLVVTTSRGKVMLKRYKASLALPAILHEHSILDYLATTDFPAPRLLHTPSGETFVQRQGRVYALSVFLDGYMHYSNYLLPPWQRRAFVFAAGEMLAILHERLRGFKPQGHNPNGFKSPTADRWRPLEWYTEKLAYCVEHARKTNKTVDRAPAGSAALLERGAWMYDVLCQLDQALEAADPLRLIIHGDYGPNNLLFKTGAPPVVLDFEIARLDWRLTDLARSVSRFAFNRFGFDGTTMKCFLSAYTALHPVTADELHLMLAVWKFLLIRRAIVCWHHACTAQSDRWNEQTQHCLKRTDWIDANWDGLTTHLEAISSPSRSRIARAEWGRAGE